MSTVEVINKEINTEIAKPEVQNALLATTFKGLQPAVMKQAIMEGMMRGFIFKDFLEKNVYAIPFGAGYSLVTSIDYARKIGMRNGVVGVSSPDYEFDEKDNTKVVSCSITVKRKVNEYIGEYSAKVYFKEYSTGKNLWVSKPLTMIAKVAEMHALRKACPQELAQSYAEEEVIKEAIVVDNGITDAIREKVNNAKTEKELKAIWDEHKGLGKEFGKLVVAQKKFLKEVKDDENENS